MTTYAGIPLFVQGMRAFDVRASIERVVAIKLRERGFDEATYLESF